MSTEALGNSIESELQPIFTLLADKETNTITSHSLYTYYKGLGIEISSPDEALNKFLLEAGLPQCDDLELTQSAFIQGITKFSNRLNLRQPGKTGRDIEELYTKMIQNNPNEAIKLLGLPPDLSSDEVLELFQLRD